ncbi:MAG: hypothetical protein J0I00_06440 [Burkholderiales bacterium]|uniref:hypothetical protein n=1 Tax=Ottowia sp. TaxID=1898956 RepID=UPI001AC65C39|nr:hypothetical protein [Ottowia sp.]MBN9405044.1 hypothetical protein [Burkholderiales bacterium]MBS0401063.1 hypothetical protein [Pseudomonadota bacterium]MBS0415107.1 hypothetical protein [Pseudomonadota bacterium]
MTTLLETSQTDARKLVKSTLTGSGIEAVGGAAAAVLAILGLAHVAPGHMLSISAIVIGLALLAQAGVLANGASDVVAREAMGRRDKMEFEGGIGAQALAGGAALVLGILSLIGLNAGVLMSVTAIVLGVGLVLESGATARLNRLDDGAPASARGTRTRRAVAGSEGVQMLIGVAAIVLGILALIGLDATTLNLVAMLAVSVSILLSGAALGGKMAGMLAMSH